MGERRPFGSNRQTIPGAVGARRRRCLGWLAGAAAWLKAPHAAGQVDVGAGFDDRMATAIAPLMVRTQGLQVLRDSTYTLCIDDMNGWIPDSATYLAIKQDRFDKALALIAKELPLLPARMASPLDAPTLPSAASAPSGSRGSSATADH